MNKGITLIEIILYIGLLAILMVGVVTSSETLSISARQLFNVTLQHE